MPRRASRPSGADTDHDAYLMFHAPGSARSARVVVDIVAAAFTVRSAVDFGCGAGAWLDAWHGRGVHDLVGCDIGPAGAAQLSTAARFVAVDLTHQVRLGRRFDLAQCLEVAEHLPPEASDILIDTLVAHAASVLFSAAVPGQGGEHHLHERPLEYWRALFRARGYVPVDMIRPRLTTRRDVEPWYRYNTLTYVAESCVATISAEVRAHIVLDGVRLREYAPPMWRLARWVLQPIPEPLVTAGARRLRRLITSTRR